MVEILLPGVGNLTDPATGKDLLVPDLGNYAEIAAAAGTAFIPLIGHGPGMSLAHSGGGLAGRANA